MFSNTNIFLIIVYKSIFAKQMGFFFVEIFKDFVFAIVFIGMKN